MPLETNEEVRTIAWVADEVPKDRDLEVEAQIQRPIEVESRGEEVAQVEEIEEINAQVLELPASRVKYSGG